MTDIVERLKDGGVFPMTFGTPDVKDVAILYDPMTPTDAIKEIERLRAALREVAEDDIYLRNCATWHDTGKMQTGVQAFARAALENK